MDRPLRIAIDVRIPDAKQGIGTAVLALAKTLSESPIQDQEYTFIIREKLRDWLSPYVYGPCSLVCIAPSIGTKQKFKSRLRNIAPLRYAWRKLRGKRRPLPQSDGLIESQQFDVVHFPTQMAYQTTVPSIYQPWDLQHAHYPQFFTRDELALRERLYGGYCRQSRFVCVQAEWTRQDVIRHFGIAPEKVVVVPWGSVFDAYEPPSQSAIDATREKYNLPDAFFFYPAITWPHKNHEVIFRALHQLKSEGQFVPEVFFTGASSEHRMVLDKLANKLGVAEHVHFLGFLPPAELQSLFVLATAMVFPSLFEGFGLPILEAFHMRLPVIAATATTLPEIAQDAALYFDPHSPEELANRMKELLAQPELRKQLADRGASVLLRHSMKHTAEALQALYARTANAEQAVSNTGEAAKAAVV